MIRTLEYETVRFAPPTVLAPMAGVTDRYFRSIARHIGGVGLVTMEFVSSESLTRGIERTLNMIAFAPEERPLSIQIYGADAARMRAAAEIVEGIGADICDINMGCPANKVLRGCAGAALMGDLGLAEGIIAAVRKAISIPLTVKFRAGLDDRRLNYLELGRVCEANGVAAVAIHPRTAKQMYSGRADWDRIARLKESLSIPVIGNGDIETADDAVAMMDQTGCDGVMIGRAAIKNPWIFREIEARWRGLEPPQVTLAERRDLMLRHFSMIRDGEEERSALHKMRRFVGLYTHGVPEAKAFRTRLSEMDTPSLLLDHIQEFFSAEVVGSVLA